MNSATLRTLLLALPLCAVVAWAADGETAADPAFDRTHAEDLHDADCSGCHGSDLYLRAGRKVDSRAALATQVTFCVTEIGAAWFPEDEQAVARYLDETFYRFPAP